MPKQDTSSGVRRLTPSEIESLRQDKKRAMQRIEELLDEEERQRAKPTSTTPASPASATKRGSTSS
jgi:hypothetical protein